MKIEKWLRRRRCRAIWNQKFNGSRPIPHWEEGNIGARIVDRKLDFGK